jgi:hypothetical protein
MRIQLWVGGNHGMLVVEELEVGLWVFNVRLEDFVCAVVQWYLECDCNSSCVKIHYLETDSED